MGYYDLTESEWEAIENDRTEPIDILMHYGTPRHSGRYPWGSGENPYQRTIDFIGRVDELKKSGLTEKEVAEAMKMTTGQLRTQYSLAKKERRMEEAETARNLRDDGYSLNQIAEKMGYKNDSSIRALLKYDSTNRKTQAQATADILKKLVDEKGMIDVGAGQELELGVSKERLNQALYILEMEGYNTFGGGIPQVTNTGKQTNLRVLCPPDTPYKVNKDGQKVSSAIYDYENVHSVRDYISYDQGETFHKSFEYPASMSSDRLQIRYAEDGGIRKDGVIELRRGVDDLSLGDAHYAQIRILVDGNRYLKGMAVYSDNMPDGVDVIFNTNKKSGTPKEDVLKKVKDDPDNPFGALIKEHGGQSYYDDPNGTYTNPVTGKKQSLSLINKTREEGDWGEWSKELPSQFLSKQSKDLIQKQLKLTMSDRQAEFDDICALTNPTVKRQLLESFASDCDSAAVHLKAAALPRQKYQVILPLTTAKDNEIYAPNYKDGETVALIRYPHGGTFEIPILKVNNKLAEGKSVMGTTSLDGVGINDKVAARLSGADFDGDTVMVIPCNSAHSKVHITSTKPLSGLEGFDPKLEYGGKAPGTFRQMKNTQKEMGVISNLITDMTLKGATESELAKAVRHSMVVIDAEKHSLDYKQSEIDNDIPALKRKYQGSYDADGKYHEGASTLLSKAKSPQLVLKRKGSPHINEDGSLSYKEVREEYIDKNGKKQVRTIQSTKMKEAKDARELISDLNTQQEQLYAEYANFCKQLANKARKEMISTGRIAYSASAAKTYENEVRDLNAKLKISLLNAPRERQAQILANSEIKAKKAANPELKDDKKAMKKLKQQALTRARESVGAKRTLIDITDREWEAIQAGAISDSKLKQILNNADIDAIRKRATPKAQKSPTTAQISRISAMKSSGYTISQIADALGFSTTTISKYLR